MWRSSPGSSERARYGVAVRALNLRACVTARLVSSEPLIPGREAEVVLDPARRARLAAERRALDDQGARGPPRRRRPRRRGPPGPPPITTRSTSSRACELEADPERARHLARRGAAQLRCRPAGARAAGSAGSSASTARDRASSECSGSRQVYGRRLLPRELDHPPRRLRRARADDLDADAVDLLQRLAAGHERGEQQVAERRRPRRAAGAATSRSTAMYRIGCGDDRRQVDGLAGQEVHLAEEARGAVPDDLVARGRRGSPPRPR